MLLVGSSNFVPLYLGIHKIAGVTWHCRPLLGPNLVVLLRKPGHKGKAGQGGVQGWRFSLLAEVEDPPPPPGNGTQHATLVLQYMDHIQKKIGELHRRETIFFFESTEGKVPQICNT